MNISKIVIYSVLELNCITFFSCYWNGKCYPLFFACCKYTFAVRKNHFCKKKINTIESADYFKPEYSQ